MFRIFTLVLALFVSTVLALAAFGGSSEARSKKRGYSIKAGHNYSSRHYRSKRHYRGRRHSRRHRRGYRVMAGHDFDRYRGGRLIVVNNSASGGYLDPEPAPVAIKIEPLRPISQIIKITEHQKKLGRKRAALRGQIGFDPNEHPLSVTGENSSNGRDNFGNYPKTYFGD